MDTSDEKINGSCIKTGRIAGSAVNKTVFWPLIGAVVLPVFIGLFEPEAIRLVWQCFYWAAFYSVPVIIFGVVYMWAHSDDGFLPVLGKFVRPVPAGMIYNSDLKKAGTPVVTISLIVANTLLLNSFSCRDTCG